MDPITILAIAKGSYSAIKAGIAVVKKCKVWPKICLVFGHLLGN